MSSRVRKVEPEKLLVNRREVEGYVRFLLEEYDKQARRRFGPWAVWTAPVRYVGAGLRHLGETLLGAALYVWRRLKGDTHEEALRATDR